MEALNETDYTRLPRKSTNRLSAYSGKSLRGVPSPMERKRTIRHFTTDQKK
jgi:hypothetical protein